MAGLQYAGEFTLDACDITTSSGETFNLKGSVMEINIFEEEDVKLIFENFVLVKLYTDGKEDIHKKNRKFEIDRFGTAALPYYVILSPDDKVLGTFPGMDPNKNNFIKFLNNSKEKFDN